MITTLFPLISETIGFSLRFTTLSRISCVGTMKERPIYRFFIRTGRKGIPETLEKPIAAGTPESGTPMTKSASTGACSQIFRRISL